MRCRVLSAAAAVLAVATGVLAALTAVSTASDGEVSILIGAFTLPDVAGQDFVCGIDVASAAPQQSASASPTTYDIGEAQASIRSMAAASLAAAAAPVRGADDGVVDVQQLAFVSTARDDNGARAGVTLDFRTADNTDPRGLGRCGLCAGPCDPGGLRYSEALPIEKMTIRDTSTIDGLIHMRITSRCSVLTQ
ncbi:MAG: hypothetical protein QM604_09515 [Microbacterium sp.]